MGVLTQRRLRRRESLAEPLASIKHPVLRRVLAQRGLREGGLDYSLGRLLPWSGLSGIDDAARCIVKALQDQRRILIVGDYDADGATGVALGMSVLTEFGARDLHYLVPDRIRYGYGLSPALARLALERQPDLVITVDNGISSIAGVAALRKAGVAVVVTDHHLPGDALPDADAIVNPNQPGDVFGSKALAGVGVMFYLLLAVRQYLVQSGHFAADTAPNMARHLDLVALGTVADLVPLDLNNRILVEQGLRRMRAGLSRPGIKALIEVAGKVPADLQASDLGFSLGPRINAAGRLEHMDCGIHCLLAESLPMARPLAEELDAINKSRQAMQQDMQETAVEAVLARQDAAAPALCVWEQSWHEGVVGLVASRLKERFHRPSIAFARAADGSLKGSARSIGGFHLRDALALLDARQPGLIQKYGGHAMAAGLSIAQADFKRFERSFVELCGDQIAPELLQAQWLSDGALSSDELSMSTVDALRQAGPWGQAWDEPLFDNQFDIVEQRIVGRGHLKLKLQMPGQRQTIDAIAFGVDEPWPHTSAHLVYQLVANDYYSPARPQLMVRGAVEA